MKYKETNRNPLISGDTHAGWPEIITTGLQRDYNPQVVVFPLLSRKIPLALISRGGACTGEAFTNSLALPFGDRVGDSVGGTVGFRDGAEVRGSSHVQYRKCVTTNAPPCRAL